MITSVGVLDHPKVPATGEVAAQIETALSEWGVRCYRANTWDTAGLHAIMPHIQMIVVLGGDGSTLRAARVSAPHNVPVVSINMGRLGFLSELNPENWRELLPRLLRGEGWIEERMMLRAQAFRGDEELGTHDALNDIVVSRGTLARVVRVQTGVGEHDASGDCTTEPVHLATYACDGLIIATPTGSTAYALAAGGPILPPTLKSIVLVPIAPHLSLDKPVVLSQGALVEMIVKTDHQAILTADGQNEITLKDGDCVRVQAGPHIARMARLQPQTYFYQTLMARMRRVE
jgi:NAD+ kinase